MLVFLFLFFCARDSDPAPVIHHEKWVHVRIKNGRISQIKMNRAALRGKYGSFYPEHRYILNYMLKNLIHLPLIMDSQKSDNPQEKKEVIARLNQDLAFHAAFRALRGDSTLEIKEIDLKEAVATCLSFFRTGPKNKPYMCIYPGNPVRLDKTVHKVLLEGFCFHTLNIFRKKDPKKFRDFLKQIRNGGDPNLMRLERLLLEERQKWSSQLPFNLSDEE